MARRPAFDLQTLLNAVSTSDFFSRFWPDRLFVGHGPKSRLKPLLKIKPLKNSASFVQHWQGTATVWPRLGKGDELLTIPSRKLASFHRRGFTLYFSKVEDELAEVNPLLRQLERDLGLRRGDMTCEAIVSRTGAGAAAHFDADCTFNLQLEGKKTWRVAPNESVAYPHKAGMIRDQLHPDMAGYARQSFPPALPEDAMSFETDAGSVVFLPHGCWHATACVADSLAIAFVVPGPKWYELFAEEVGRELLKFAEARQLSMVGSRASRKAAETVLGELRSIVGAMEVERLLKRWSGPPSIVFRRVGLARLKPSRSTDPGPSRDADLELRPLLRWVAEAPDVFSAHEAMDALPKTDSSVILRGLFKLVAAGVLELG